MLAAFSLSQLQPSNYIVFIYDLYCNSKGESRVGCWGWHFTHWPFAHTRRTFGLRRAHIDAEHILTSRSFISDLG